MECKKVRDQLKTGYLDKELGAEEHAVAEQHLAACRDCREFFLAVQRIAVAPFKDAGEMQPDNAVWERIQARIGAEQARSQGGFGRLVDSLVSCFPLPVPVMRVAFATALILGVVVLVNWPSSYADPVQGYVSEQMAFMGDLGAGNTDLLNGDLKDYDAALEEFGA